ncbi:hypothetical protein OEZ49_11145 [Ruegeria sp. WL0004]|uniref:DUF2393 domain-containing protein n=1 Tax=Ruegeria marisflavi TaxID=2984152 RepID=A0ABT2WQY1_9RHOB|nr:hypothetical protein [Ruegeria sp. WL0004]MCU9838323.1 hypothetical protein [Ruegeria sp. WL0004]
MIENSADQAKPYVRKSHSAQKSSLRHGDLLALGVTIGVCLAIVFLLLNDVLNSGLDRNEFIAITPALLTLSVALVSLVVSFYALSEQRLMRQAGTDPVVIAHLGQRKDQPMLINLEISNVGAGAAINVTIKAILPPEWPFLDRVLRDPRDLTHPIMTILQNRSVSFAFGVGHQLIGDNPIEPFKIQLSYEDVEGSSYFSEHIIDVKELTWQDANTPPITKISKELEKIQKALSKLTQHSELHVVAETQAEFEARRKREDEEMRTLFKRSKET